MWDLLPCPGIEPQAPCIGSMESEPLDLQGSLGCVLLLILLFGLGKDAFARMVAYPLCGLGSSAPAETTPQHSPVTQAGFGGACADSRPPPGPSGIALRHGGTNTHPLSP